MQDLLMQNMHWILYMRSNIGVNIDELYISQPDSGDQALEITETTGAFRCDGYYRSGLCSSACTEDRR